MAQSIDIWDRSIKFEGEDQPSPATIIWRYYMGIHKDSSKASETTNAYLRQATGEDRLYF